MDELIKKLNSLGIKLQDSDVASLTEAIETVINESVNKKVALAVEEKQKELDKLSEEYVEAEIAKKTEEITAKLEEAKKVEMEALESSLVDTLDKFIDSEISENISNELLTKVAINETLVPLVDGIKKVFEDNHIVLESEGATIVKESQDKIKELEDQNSTLIAEKMELNEKVALFEKANLLDEKTEGLSEDQQVRIFKMFKDSSIDEINEKVDDFIDLVINEENKPTSTDKTSVIAEDGIVPTVKKVIKEDNELGLLAAEFV